MAENALQRAAVVLKAAHNERYIPPAAAPAHERDRLRGGKLALGGDVVRAPKLDLPVGCALNLRIAEKIVGKKGEGVLPLCAESLHLGARSQLLRAANKRAGGAAAQLEYLASYVDAVKRQAHGKLRARREHSEDDLKLLLCEVDKAVYIHVRAAAEYAAGYLRFKHGEPVGGVGAAAAHNGVIAFKHERKVGKLVTERVIHFRRCTRQRLARHAGGFQLVHRMKQHILKLRLSLCARIHAQPRRRCLERERHAQKPPALVERGPRAAAVQAHHAPRKAGERKHLRIQRERVAAAQAELPLRLVAVLLRHDEKSLPLAVVYGITYLLNDGRGLADTRAADYQSEHRPFPFLTFFCLFYQKNAKLSTQARLCSFFNTFIA